MSSVISSSSKIQAIFKTALHLLQISKRECAIGISTFTPVETGYAVASGACVLALLFMGVTLTRMNEPTGSHQIASVHSRLDRTEDLVTPSSLLLAPPARMSAATGARRSKARRARLVRSAERSAPKQTFSPPRVSTASPQLVVMLAYDAPMQAPAELIPPQFEEPSLWISPPPLERVSGVRRLLQAIAYPFKRVGQGLAN